MGKAARRIKNLAAQKKVVKMRAQAKKFGCRLFTCKEPSTMSELVEASIDGLVSFLMLKPKTVKDILENARVVDWPTFQLMLGIITCYNDQSMHPNSPNPNIKGVANITYLMSKEQKKMFKAICWLCRGNQVCNKSPEECFAEVLGIDKESVDLPKEVKTLIREIRSLKCKDNVKEFIPKLEHLSQLLSEVKTPIFKKKKKIKL